MRVYKVAGGEIGVRGRTERDESDCKGEPASDRRFQSHFSRGGLRAPGNDERRDEQRRRRIGEPPKRPHRRIGDKVAVVERRSGRRYRGADRGSRHEAEAHDLDHAERRVECLAAERQCANEVTARQPGAERPRGHESADNRRLSGDRRRQIAAEHDARPQLRSEHEQEAEGKSRRREQRYSNRIEPEGDLQKLGERGVGPDNGRDARRVEGELGSLTCGGPPLRLDRFL